MVGLRAATELWDDTFNINFGPDFFKSLGNSLGHCPMRAKAARTDLAVEEMEKIKWWVDWIMFIGQIVLYVGGTIAAIFVLAWLAQFVEPTMAFLTGVVRRKRSRAPIFSVAGTASSGASEIDGPAAGCVCGDAAGDACGDCRARRSGCGPRTASIHGGSRTKKKVSR